MDYVTIKGTKVYSAILYASTDKKDWQKKTSLKERSKALGQLTKELLDLWEPGKNQDNLYIIAAPEYYFAAQSDKTHFLSVDERIYVMGELSTLSKELPKNVALIPGTIGLPFKLAGVEPIYDERSPCIAARAATSLHDPERSARCLCPVRERSGESAGSPAVPAADPALAGQRRPYIARPPRSPDLFAGPPAAGQFGRGSLPGSRGGAFRPAPAAGGNIRFPSFTGGHRALDQGELRGPWASPGA